MYICSWLKTWQPPGALPSCLQAVFEAVRGGPLAALAVLLTPLAEEQSLLMEEEVALHGLEAGQVFHGGRASPPAGPHTEGALHQQPAQLTQRPLEEHTGNATTSRCLPGPSHLCCASLQCDSATMLIAP